MRAALTALLLASSLQQTAAEAWGPAPTPLPELGLKGTALLGGTVLGCSALAGSFAFVRQGEACLIERLGRYKRTLTAGLHPKIPFIESVAAYSSIRERVLDVPAQRCITKPQGGARGDAGGAIYEEGRLQNARPAPARVRRLFNTINNYTRFGQLLEDALALIHLGGSGFGSGDSSCGDGCGDGRVGSRCVLLEAPQLVPASHHLIEPPFQKAPESYLNISRDCQIASIVLLIHNAKSVLDLVIYKLPF